MIRKSRSFSSGNDATYLRCYSSHAAYIYATSINHRYGTFFHDRVYRGPYYLHNRTTPYRRKSTPPILTRHLYHHTPLVEYILKHLYMYPRTRVFGSWDITQTYHRPYAYICMHMHSYGYTCVQMHPDARPLPHPRLTLHAYVCICIHMSTYACRCVHMHTH